MFINSLQSLKSIFKNLKDEEKVLPLSVSKDNIKCLDFDLDKVVFKSVGKKIEVNPYNKTWLEVMDMV